MADPVTTLASSAQYATWAGMNGLAAAPTSLSTALAQATAELQQYCGREFLPSPVDDDETEQRTCYGDGSDVLWVNDLLSLDSVTSSGEVGSYTQERDRHDGPVTRLRKTEGNWAEHVAYVVAGRFGYAEQADLPADLVEACCILTALRLTGAAEWASRGLKRTWVINVSIEYEQTGAALEAKRQESLRLAQPYRRVA